MRSKNKLTKLIPVSVVVLTTLGTVGVIIAPGASAANVNGACTKAQRNSRVMLPDGSYLVCIAVGKKFRWKPTGPKHGEACVQE
jgi:hypothetical protein